MTPEELDRELDRRLRITAGHFDGLRHLLIKQRDRFPESAEHVDAELARLDEAERSLGEFLRWREGQ